MNASSTLTRRYKKQKSMLGSTAPWAWVIEPVHGCNLRCGHCSCRLDKPNTYHYIKEDSWIQAWSIISKVAPTTRADLCLGGEPTLHPDIYQLLKLARKISPLTQIQITTNGTMLLSGKLEYRELLAAGANIIYTDMYGPHSKFVDMAKESGIAWYEYYKKPKDAPSPWTYNGPDLKLIVLQEQPENWPKSRYRAGLLGTWFNHLDWEAAKRFGLTPVTQAPARRCNQPFRYSCIDSKGYYLLCCQDNVGETSGMFGNVSEGVDGFLKFWYGKKMQTYRVNLMAKNRMANSQCSRCNITFSRCDYKHWKDEQLRNYWTGKEWLPLNAKIQVRARSSKQY